MAKRTRDGGWAAPPGCGVGASPPPLPAGMGGRPRSRHPPARERKDPGATGRCGVAAGAVSSGAPGGAERGLVGGQAASPGRWAYLHRPGFCVTTEAFRRRGRSRPVRGDRGRPGRGGSGPGGRVRQTRAARRRAPLGRRWGRAAASRTGQPDTPLHRSALPAVEAAAPHRRRSATPERAGACRRGPAPGGARWPCWRRPWCRPTPPSAWTGSAGGGTRPMPAPNRGLGAGIGGRWTTRTPSR